MANKSHSSYFNNGNVMRDLHIWDIRDGRDRVIQGVHSYAESQVTWSPDSSMIGYTDPNAGIVVVKLITSEVRYLSGENPASNFAWAPDSQSIMTCLPTDINILIRININGDIIRQYKLNESENGRELNWNKSVTSILLMTKVIRPGTPTVTRISTLELASGNETNLYESQIDIYNPQFAPNGDGIIFLEYSPCCRNMYYLKDGTQLPVQLTALEGWTDFGSSSPYGDTVPYEHFSGDDSHELRGISLITMKDSVLYKDPVGDPDTSHASRVISSLESGHQLNGLLWKPSGQSLGLIVELHNVSGTETPILFTYDAEYRYKALIANRSGYAYLYVNCYLQDISNKENIATQMLYGNELSSLVANVQLSINVLPQATLLVGYSVGTTVVLSSVVDAPERYGAVVLVGISEQGTTRKREGVAKEQ